MIQRTQRKHISLGERAYQAHMRALDVESKVEWPDIQRRAKRAWETSASAVVEGLGVRRDLEWALENVEPKSAAYWGIRDALEKLKLAQVQSEALRLLAQVTMLCNSRMNDDPPIYFTNEDDELIQGAMGFLRAITGEDYPWPSLKKEA